MISLKINPCFSHKSYINFPPPSEPSQQLKVMKDEIGCDYIEIIKVPEEVCRYFGTNDLVMVVDDCGTINGSALNTKASQIAMQYISGNAVILKRDGADLVDLDRDTEKRINNELWMIGDDGDNIAKINKNKQK